MNVSSPYWSPFHANNCVFYRNQQEKVYIKSNVLPTSHENHQSQLLLELDELRLKCSTYESTIDNLEKEKASLLEVIKILPSSEDRENSDPTHSSISNEPTDGSEWTKVSNAKSKKQKNKKTKKNGTGVNEDVENRLNDNNSSSQALRQSTSNSAQSTDQKPCVVIAGDSMLKFINGRKLSSQISNQGLTYVKAFPGATVEDMSDYIMPSLRRNLKKLSFMLVRTTSSSPSHEKLLKVSSTWD